MRKPLRLERRHFAFIAAVLADIEDDDVRRDVACRFAGRLSTTNGLFNSSRFLEAAKAVRQ